MNDFNKQREGTGFKEWGEYGFSIGTGCANNCIYCFAAYDASTRFSRIPSRAAWETETLNKNAVIHTYPKKDGVVIYPKTHDITPYYLQQSIHVLKVILGSGNQVLIVSKPHFFCVEAMCARLAEFKSQILFRFTIGTLDARVARFWEPGATSPAERIKCLRYAFEKGFQTSVSAEPLLGGHNAIAHLLPAVEPYITDSIWIGKMNRIRQRVDMTSLPVSTAVRDMEHLQRDSQIIKIYEEFKDNPKVRWKDSFKTVIDKYLAVQKS